MSEEKKGKRKKGKRTIFKDEMTVLIK
jgi:hypothetical protein